MLEARSREYVEHRVRAGVLEQGTVDVLTETGVAERLHREGMVHHGLELRFGGVGHRIALSELAGGRAITVYGQQEVVKDLIAARLDAGGELRFEAAAEAIDTERGVIRLGGRRRAALRGRGGLRRLPRRLARRRARGRAVRLRARVSLRVAGDPGPRRAVLGGADLHPSRPRLRAALACARPRSPASTSRWRPDEELDDWPDARIWEELQTRMATADGGFALNEGEIFDKGIAPMRSFVAEPMRHGRLFLAGDAAHIVPATGAKGLNLAVADVRVLARGLRAFFEHGDEALLDDYSDRCLRRVWRVQHFSWFMTQMLHRLTGDPFEARLQRAQLDYVVRSRAAATSLAENYVGLELEDV